VCIPETDDASARRSADSVPNSSKGTAKEAPTGATSRLGSWPQHIDVEVSEEDIPLQRRRKLSRGSGSVVSHLKILNFEMLLKFTKF
jgi:hypothetical protein